MRNTFIWIALASAVAVPIGFAAVSPLLAWRDPIYVIAGFAGVVAMALMLLQPVLAAGYLPGFSARTGRRVHRWVGFTLALSVAIHVVGLWITSPPDVIDALLFVSPTPFSIWGVIAMWGITVTTCLVAFRRRFGIHLRWWRLAHRTLAAVIVIGSVLHVVLIEGTMETWSKSVLCLLVLVATAMVLADFKRST